MDESGRYALGALFSLALHSNEIWAGAKEIHKSQAPWGQHSHEILSTNNNDSEDLQGQMASLWDAYWGYDLVHANGLMERVYQRLTIPEASWPGLKALPEVASSAGYQQLVVQYREILDSSLKGRPAPAIPLQPPRVTITQDQDSSSLRAAVEEDDEDLAGDLRRAQFSAPGQSSHKSASTVAQEGSERENLTSVKADTLSSRSSGAAQGQDVSKTLEQHLEGGLRISHDSMTASELSAQTPQVLAAAAFQASTELLEACMASLDQPHLEDIVKADKEHKKAAKVKTRVEQSGTEKPANVRWYDSRAREALKAVASWLQVPWDKLLLYECLLAQQSQAPEVTGNGQKQLSSKERRLRALKIGAAAAGGGALLAITGGLAAPALAAVAGTVMTTVGGSAAAATAVTGIMGSTVGAAAMIAGFGAGGAHVVGGKMARRVGDVKEFGFRAIPEDDFHSSYSARIPAADASEAQQSKSEQSFEKVTPSSKAEGKKETAKNSWFSGSSSSGLSWLPWSKKPEVEAVPLLPIPVSPKPRPDPKLSRTIAVAGCVAEPDDFVNLWRSLGSVGSERFTLVWETQELMELNSSIMDMLLSQAYSQAGKYLIEKFVIHGLVGAVSLPLTILNVSSIIDSTWAVVMNRAARAGELLAHLLMSGAHGDCPVILIGNSMGARLIFYCLLELCRCQCKGIVQHAVMLGTPVDVLPERWAMARSVVAGRCINGYSRKDWVLALSFRARQGTFRPAAGLGEVPVPGIENVDLTPLVHGHGDYIKRMDDVLQELGLSQPHDVL